jgi:hypothetical protein
MNSDQIKTLEAISSGFANIGYRLEYSETPIITGVIYKPTPKARLKKEKMIYGYRFKTVESLIKNIQTQLNNITSNIEHDIKMKAERKAKEKEDANAIQVGDILHADWGFEQTQCDYYQVIDKPTPNSVIVREITRETVKEHGWASEYCRPVKDAFVGEPEKFRLIGDSIKLSSFKRATKIQNPETATHYRSWYY